MTKTIGIIGGGNMGAALLARLKAGYKVVVAEKDAKRRRFLKGRLRVSVLDIPALVKKSEVIILAVKPQDFDGVLRDVAPGLTPRKLVVSIAAGITTRYIEKILPSKTRVIRVMPNLPALIGEGMTAVCRGRHARKGDVATACRILGRVGSTVVVREDLMDAVTAVSGSGPAYVFLFVECLTRAAEALGLDTTASRLLVRKTLSGSVHLLDEQDESPAALRAKVTSKGGTTEAAVAVLTKKKIDQVYRQALGAAARRARQLARR